MKQTWLKIGLVAGGVILILVGLVVRFVLVPGMKVVPANLDVVRTYQGTLTMLDPNTFEFYQEVPVHIVRYVKMEKVDGSKGLISELAELYTGDQLIQSRRSLYAIDRHTLSSIQGFGEDWPREGLTISYPIGTHKRDYQGWNEDAQQVETAQYVRTETYQGVKTYVFEIDTGPDPIRDPFLVELLPRQLDKSLLLDLVDQFPLNDAQRALAARLLPGLPDPVPLDYLYSSDLTLWVEPTTGMVVDLHKHEWRMVALNGLPVAPIFEMDWRHTPETIADSIDEAKPLITQVRWLEGILPWVAWIVGAILVGVGLVLRLKSVPPE